MNGTNFIKYSHYDATLLSNEAARMQDLKNLLYQRKSKKLISNSSKLKNYKIKFKYLLKQGSVQILNIFII